MGARGSLALFLGLVSLGGASGCAAGFRDRLEIPVGLERRSIDIGQYPGVPALFLYDLGRSDLLVQGREGSLEVRPIFTRKTKVKLLTRAATEQDAYGSFHIQHRGELLSVSGFVEKGDGSRVALGEDDIVTRLVEKERADFSSEGDLFETVLVFPGLEVGDSVASSFTQRGLSFHWSFSQVGAYVRHSEFSFTEAARLFEIQERVSNRHGLRVERSLRGLGFSEALQSSMTEYRWTARDVPPIREELFMPPLAEVGSFVLLSAKEPESKADELFLAYGRWLARPRASARIERLARGLGGGSSDPRAVARKIREWVMAHLNIRDPEELTDFRPAEPPEPIDLDRLLDEAEATPEQAVALMGALLSRLGIATQILLTADQEHPPVEPRLAALTQFTHVFLGLGEGHYLDITESWRGTGDLPWPFQGRRGILLDRGRVRGVTLPRSIAGDNQDRLEARAVIADSGRMDATIRVRWSGEKAFLVRKVLLARSKPERDEWAREWIGRIDEKVILDGYSLSLSEPEGKTVEASFRYHAEALVARAGRSSYVPLASLVNLTRCPSLPPGARHNPISFPFPFSERIDITVQLPRGLRLSVLPQDSEFEAPGVLLRTGYRPLSPRSLLIQRRLEISAPTLGAEGYPALQAQLSHFLEEKGKTLVLVPARALAPTS